MDGRRRSPGNVQFAAKTAEFFRDNIMLPFFVYYLKPGKEDPKLPRAYVFETGQEPVAEARCLAAQGSGRQTLYFREGGKLAIPPPAAGQKFDEYVSDPAKPVPFTDETSPGMTYDYMTSDQRFAARRTDVLVYSTRSAGGGRHRGRAPRVHAARLHDGHRLGLGGEAGGRIPGEFPDPDPNPTGVRMGGYQQLVRGEPFRGRFHKSFEKPAPFEPGKVTKVAFTMPDVYHTFRRGHRIMVHVQVPGSRWWTGIRRSSSTPSTGRRRRTSRRRRSGCTGRPIRRRDQGSHAEIRLLLHRLDQHASARAARRLHIEDVASVGARSLIATSWLYRPALNPGPMTISGTWVS